MEPEYIELQKICIEFVQMVTVIIFNISITEIRENIYQIASQESLKHSEARNSQQ